VHGNHSRRRPLWPVLGRVGNLLSRRGLLGGDGRFLERAPRGTGKAEGLAAVLLGEYGSVAEEEGILRRFRGGGGSGIPVLLIGGQSAAGDPPVPGGGGDMVFRRGSFGREEILDRAQPLLAYGRCTGTPSSPDGNFRTLPCGTN